MEIDERFFNEPLLSTSFTPKNFRQVPWRDLNTPQAINFVGDKRSGKDNAMDIELEIGLDNGFTCVSIFDGGSHEKLYTAVSKNCRDKWKLVDTILKIFEELRTDRIEKELVKQRITDLTEENLHKFLVLMEMQGLIRMGKRQVGITEKGVDELEGRLLHCNCHKPRPVTVLKPPYVKYNKADVDRFNGYYFKDYAEYLHAFVEGDVPEMVPIDSDFPKIKKPKELIEKITPMLKIVEAPVPRGSKENIKQFLEIFTREILDCRVNRRFFIPLNTEFFPPNHEGKLDMYTTFAVIMNYLRPISNEHFKILKLDKPRNEWTSLEKSWHKIMLFVGEVRKPAPQQSLSPEPEASVSKRAFFAFMPQSRHAKTWVRVNAQSIGDVLKGVNKQQDLIIVKRSSGRNLGEELGWLNKEVGDEIEKQLIRWKFWKIENGKVIRTSLPNMVNEKLLHEKDLVPVAELPDNKAYVVNGNEEWRITTYGTPSWHHKSDRDEFENDTGISFKIDEKYNYSDKITDDSESERGSGISQKKHKNEIYSKAFELDQTTNLTKEGIQDELKKFFANDETKLDILNSLKPKSFMEGFRRWRMANKKE